MPALAGALAMTAKVDRERAHSVRCHPSGKALVPPGVLAKAMRYRERYAGPILWPGPVCDLRAVGGFQETVRGDGPLRRQGVRSL